MTDEVREHMKALNLYTLVSCNCCDEPIVIYSAIGRGMRSLALRDFYNLRIDDNDYAYCTDCMTEYLKESK